MGIFQREWIGILMVSVKRMSHETRTGGNEHGQEEGIEVKAKGKEKEREGRKEKKVHAIRKLAELGKFVFRH
jgi:hypothetical protein